MPEEIEFYDLKSKDRFKTTEYRVEERKGRFFAVAKSPTGDYECWKVLGKEQAERVRNAA
jgi:hypothetical protein